MKQKEVLILVVIAAVVYFLYRANKKKIDNIGRGFDGELTTRGGRKHAVASNTAYGGGGTRYQKRHK